MFPSGKTAVGSPGSKGQAALCVALAVAFALGGDRLTGIERTFYDLSQRLAAGASQAPVVIVKPDDAINDLWTQPRLGELLTNLDAAGARAILPATPSPVPVNQADVDRLRTLIRLEERSGTLPKGAASGQLRRQLAEAEQRLAQQQEVAAAMKQAGNVVLGLGTEDRHDGLGPVARACADRVVASGGQFASQAQEIPVLASLAPTSGMLCQAAAAVAQVAVLTDRDGIVRQAAPVLLTPTGTVPSSALAALQLGGRTAPATGLLARYYRSAAGAGGFPVVASHDVLDGKAGALIKDRYVVLGNPDAGTAGSIRTPLHGTIGPATFIATDLANYLGRDHITRPGWAIWVEIGMAILLAGAVLLGAGLGTTHAALLTGSAVALLLLIEYLLLSVAGIWLHLAGLALFLVIGTVVLRLFRRFAGVANDPQPATTPAATVLASGPTAELDLGFSVLRQQPTTERTKQQLYALAMEHGKKRDYAKVGRPGDGGKPGPGQPARVGAGICTCPGTCPAAPRNRGSSSGGSRSGWPIPGRPVARPLRTRTRDRARRDGHGLSRPGPDHQPPGRHQDDATGRGVRRKRPGDRTLALPARSGVCRAVEPPEHHLDL
ncbi:MAG: CHASE2 domain-containing protein [Gammaproteobacteria bacterium PRO9]|nr:CHASE2 domain-containing protein [Gammaproteobacteria bacterium PRO9]